MITYFPKYFTNRAIFVYVLLLLLMPIFFGYPMHWYWWLFGIAEVAGFFYFTNVLSKTWQCYHGKAFENKLYSSALLLRVFYVLFSYAFYFMLTGDAFEFSAADSRFYDTMGRWGSEELWAGTFEWKRIFENVDFSDCGYPLYLMAIYAITGKSIIVVRLLKAVLSAYTVVLVYRLAQRNFGDATARISGIFCLLMPNLIYYCGLHLKETEMLFLTVLFIERADFVFREKKAKFGDILFVLIVGLATFFFRAVLCYVLFLTLVASVVFGSSRIKKGGKWAIEGLLLVMLGVAGYFQVGQGTTIDTEEYQNVREQQVAAMQWRSERKGGNSFAKYAGAAVFAPLIFTIPFPTMVNIEYQQNQQMIHGGNFVKNINSFFTILALFLLLLNGGWRDNIVPLAFMAGYLIVLVFSNFAQAERFHIPALPFELMFASYAITHFKPKCKTWFTIWLLFIFVANIGWAWLKLRGRGM